MARLIFLGPPGAGKGTQAQIVAARLGIPHISTGDILRHAVAQKTALGVQAQDYMDRGALVPDQLLEAMIEERLRQPDTQSGWLLDGYPRTLPQAVYLDTLLSLLGQPYDRALNLEVGDETLVGRLLSRGRRDDTEPVIRHRLQVYRDQTAPLIDFYQQRHHLLEVNGDQELDLVTQSLLTALSAAGLSVPSTP